MLQTITFVSHNASRSGAPLLLLRMITELSKASAFEMNVLLLNDGPLAVDFENVVPTYLESFYFRNRYSVSDSLLYKLGLRRFNREARYNQLLQKKIQQSDIIFCNTVVSLKALKNYDLNGKRIFFFIHELDFAVKVLLTPDEMKSINELSEKIFVPADFVKNFLVEKYKFPVHKIEKLKYVIPKPQLSLAESSSSSGTFKVGCCGSLESRKGADIFLLVAFEILKKQKQSGIEFYWIGAQTSSPDSITFANDLEKTGMKGLVHIIEATPLVEQYLKTLDVFLLPSREDPYPVVVLEAASLTVPTIYFKNAGGIGEFLSDGGVEIEYMNVEEMAKQVTELKNNKERLSRLKENVFKRYQQESDATKIVNQLKVAFERR